MSTPAQPSTALATIETFTALELFTPGAIDPILERIEQEARETAANLEISTEVNRRALASLAYKIARSKTYIDERGKDLTEDMRKSVEAINSERKRARERLEALKDEIRQPLTEWENLEKSRVVGHEAALLEIEKAASYTASNWQRLSSEAIADRLKEIESDSRNWQEFAQRAAGVKAVTLNSMRQAYANSHALEVERAEAERLRSEAAELAIKEREQAAAKAATEAAEERARQAQEAAQRAAEAERTRMEREVAESDARARQVEARRIADGQEAQRKADLAEARRIADEQAATRRAEQAAGDAQRAQERAIEAERQRAAAEVERERLAAEKREANKRHVKKVDAEAVRALQFLMGNLPEADVKKIIAHIAAHAVPHVSISY